MFLTSVRKAFISSAAIRTTAALMLAAILFHITSPFRNLSYSSYLLLYLYIVHVETAVVGLLLQISRNIQPNAVAG